MKENWKTWKEMRYTRIEVSDLGNVRRIYTRNRGKSKVGDITYPKALPNNYLYIGNFYVHKIVAEVFLPNPENKPCVDHINTDRQDNRPCNLKWCTYQENIRNPKTLQRVNANAHRWKSGNVPFNAGYHWWNNGIQNKMSKESPGEGWTLGRI